jgi:D-alanyl-D-alanine carboxypeptidase
VQTKISSVNSNSVVRKRNVARRISVRNHNRLLWNFDGAIGGKTGYTLAAQKCFVGAVTRNGLTLIVSILGARNLWADTRELLEYGFDHYQTLKAATLPAGKTSINEPVTLRSERIASILSVPQEDKIASGYLLQVGSFRERERAEALMKQFSENGFEALVEKVALTESQTSYRVRVGPYAELLEAQEVAQEILNKSGLRALILPAPAQRENSDNAN